MTDTVALRPYARAWFFYFAAIGVYTLYAPLWFKEHGLSALAIGAIASVQSWTRVIAPYGWAWAADRSRHRVRLLRWAGVISALAALALALTGRFGFGAIVACVAVLFLANGAVMPLTEASLAHHLNLAAGGGGGRYGRTRVWGSVGFILSVSGFGFVLQRSGLWPGRGSSSACGACWRGNSVACPTTPSHHTGRPTRRRARWRCCAGPRSPGSSAACS